MSVLHSYSYWRYSSPLCHMNQTCKKKKSHDRLIYQKIPLIRPSLCQKIIQATGLRAAEIKWRLKQINLKETNSARAQACSHTGLKITPVIIQLQVRVHSQFNVSPFPVQGISMCVHKYWVIRWTRGPLHSGIGVLTLNAWVTDYFLTSWT